jgi:hypothetical protein
MNTYQITISKLGQVIQILEGITANSALEAIDRIEQQFKAHDVWLSHKDNSVCYSWTGYEFSAKRMSMVLS